MNIPTYRIARGIFNISNKVNINNMPNIIKTIDSVFFSTLSSP